MFNPYLNKISFDAFTMDAPPCPKCNTTTVVIIPTTNTHAASSRCPNCGKFFRWLGKNELSHYIKQELIVTPSPDVHCSDHDSNNPPSDQIDNDHTSASMHTHIN